MAATYPSYGTIAEANTYWAAHGSPSQWTGATDAAKQLALVKASEYLDSTYRWIGDPADRTTQVRGWPRIYAYVDNYEVTGIPQIVKDATAILALETIKGVDLLPDMAAGETEGNVTEVSVQVGPIRESIGYQEGTARRSSAPRFPRVTALLRSGGLIQSGYSRDYGLGW